jgi:tRNA (guanine37-N1)-methyltransferase
MRIDIVTVSPELIQSPFEHSIIKRAREKGLVEVFFHDLRDYEVNSYGKIDDYQFGGGAGMVLMIEPIDKCLSQLMRERKYDELIYMTPDAPTLNQQVCNRLSSAENLLVLTGHYKGVDQRVRDKFITMEVSIGDYVLSGGEIPAMMVADAVARLVPGVLGDEASAEEDSFESGLLDCPHYTRPETAAGLTVPTVLLSGDHAAIRRWRLKQALGRTWSRRPELLAKKALSAEERALLDEYIAERATAGGDGNQE